MEKRKPFFAQEGQYSKNISNLTYNELENQSPLRRI